MLKKIAVVFCALLLILTVTLPVSAAESTFTEDFSSGDLSNWSNPTLDAIAGVEDAETKGVAQIVDGALEIENASTMGNFYYIGVKDLKTLNFTLTMKVRIDLFNDGWIGVSFRKDFNERYNACNNNMITMRAQTDHKLSLQGYRGYAGSIVLLNNSVPGGFVMEEGTEWVTWKIEVNGSIWKSYINDTQLGEWSYEKNQNEGFISINACIFDGAVDDIEITGDIETVAPPATEPPADDPADEQPTDAPATQAPTQAPTMPSADEPDTSYIKSTYKDVTIDYLYSVITLDNPLSVSDFYLSFKLSDYYTLKVVDASGAEITDESMMVTEDMKAVVYRGQELAKEYTLVVNETEQVKPPVKGSQSNDAQGLPTGAIVAIIVAVILAAGAVAAALILKKKSAK